MIVDDRVAIIGSANINERSQRGNRDSEFAAIIRDNDLVEAKMGDKPYLVGRFSHTLRVRLMREHLGVNVDEMEQMEMHMDGLAKACKYDKDAKVWNPQTDDFIGGSGKLSPTAGLGSEQAQHASEVGHSEDRCVKNDILSNDHGVDLRSPEITSGTEAVQAGWFNDLEHLELPEDFGRPRPSTTANPLPGAIPSSMRRSTNFAEDLEHAKRDPDQGLSLRMHKDVVSEDSGKPNRSSEQRKHAAKKKLHELFKETGIKPQQEPIRSHIHLGSGNASPLTLPTKQEGNFEELHQERFTNPINGKKIATVDPYAFDDPLSHRFYFDTWCSIANSNTDIYRQAFRCQPDDQVRTWKDYHVWEKHSEELAQMQGGHRDQQELAVTAKGSGPVGAPQGKIANKINKKKGHTSPSPLSAEFGEDSRVNEKQESGEGQDSSGNSSYSSDTLVEKEQREQDIRSQQSLQGHALAPLKTVASDSGRKSGSHSRQTGSMSEKKSAPRHQESSGAARTDFSSDMPSVDMIEKMLCGVRGHLVTWPTEWLLDEDEKGSYLFTLDKVQPLEIYD